MTYIKYFLLLTFYLLSPDTFAGVFDVVATDKSKEYLGMIFGGSIGAVTLGGGANPLLSKMFERFNFIIVTFGVLILSYTGIVAAINTAREGEPMGKKFSLWVPIRSLLGMLMMLPSPGTGYSVIQMTVIWVVLNGIGAANAVWNVVLDQLAAGIKAVGQVELQGDDLGVDLRGQINQLTENILKMSVCKNVLNQQSNLEFTKNHGPITINFPKIDQSRITPQSITRAGSDLSVSATGKTIHQGDISTYTPSAIITVGAPNTNNLDLAVCGHMNVSVVVDYRDPNFSAATALNYLQTKVNAIKAIFDVVESAAGILSKPHSSTPQILSGVSGTFLTAYNHYMAQNIQLVVTPKTNDHTRINTLKSFGWIHAGSYYFSLSQGNKINAMNAIRLPTLTGVPLYNEELHRDPAHVPTGFPVLLDTALHAQHNKTELNNALKRVADFSEDDQQSEPGLPILGSDYPSTSNKFLDKTLADVLQGIRAPILKFFSTELTGKTEDPLLSIGSLGTNLMLAGELTVFGLVVGAFLTMLSVSTGSCLTPLPWAPQMLLFTIIPGLAALLVLVWSMGATLGIYVPMIPYSIFIATAIGWMLAVIEAVVAAPIIALGLIQPSGEELGKIVPALGILIHVFLKPVLMIFGFVIAGSLLRAILNMVNFSFMGALNIALPYPTFFSIIPTLALYTFLIIAVVNQAFSLIYELPNKALRYMGVTPEGSNPEKLISESKGGIEKGSQAGQEVQKGATEQAMKHSTDAMKKTGRGGELPKHPPPGAGGL